MLPSTSSLRTGGDASTRRRATPLWREKGTKECGRSQRLVTPQQRHSRRRPPQTAGPACPFLFRHRRCPYHQSRRESASPTPPAASSFPDLLRMEPLFRIGGWGRRQTSPGGLMDTGSVPQKSHLRIERWLQPAMIALLSERGRRSRFQEHPLAGTPWEDL